MLVRVTGWLVMIEALFMCAPVALALVNDDADRCAQEMLKLIENF